jgi:hypothetical protein
MGATQIDESYLSMYKAPDTGQMTAYYAPPGQPARYLTQQEINSLQPLIKNTYDQIATGQAQPIILQSAPIANIDESYLSMYKAPDTGQMVAYYQPPGQEGRKLTQDEIDNLQPIIKDTYNQIAAGTAQPIMASGTYTPIDESHLSMYRAPDTGQMVAYYQPPGETGRKLTQDEINNLPPIIKDTYDQIAAGQIEPILTTEQETKIGAAGATAQPGATAGEIIPPSDTPPSEANKVNAEAAKKNFEQARQDWAAARNELQKAQNELDNADFELEYATTKEEQNKALDKVNAAEDKLAAAKKKEQEERAAFNAAQWTFTGIVSNIVTAYRRYAGLSGISSLIFDEKFLADWKTSVNEFFCKTIVLGGIDCWASKICGQYTEIAAPRDGVLFTSPIGGSPDAVAHIEGMRSLPIETPNGTAWVYTVTFGLTNPEEDDEMSYNVVFGGEKTASWWQTPPTISSGASAAATGASALMKLSKTNYKEVCLTFSPEIKSFDGKEVGKICNDFSQYAGGATAPYAGVGGNETTPAAAPSTPGTPGASI